MVKVLIVDDSVLFAGLLKNKLSAYSGINVVGTASNPYEARDKILELEPDVMTLDIEMPRMDGVKFLQKLMPQYPLPVVMISSLESRSGDAIRAGAAGFHVKPAISDNGAVNFFIKGVAEEILRLGGEAPSPASAYKPASYGGSGGSAESAAPSNNLRSTITAKTPVDIVALGASTGGTDALEIVVSKLSSTCPPVIITQHMPPVFTRMYAERLNRTSPLAVFEAVDGMRLNRGMCVIAEGGKHMELHRDAKGYFISSKAGEKVSGHCPSVDVMFTSAAKCSGKATVAALLTGMGADGAQGLLKLKHAGAYTIGQNKESCIVYGMPMEAYKLGAVCEEAHLNDISGIIMRKVNLN
ncbi:MAG: chemotaxis-specific protein-glutamate methyltransferase CheB [Ruminococcus sp.]|nr:chemotaxis-specific protein-glutamate methyltransferase CheB [Ruminococcus sp.]